MLTLLITVVLGVAFAIFATQNTEPTTINLGDFALTSVPTYLVVLIPLTVGLILAYLLYLVKDLSQNLTIDEQKDKIRTLKKELAETTKTAHKLQVENVKMKQIKGGPKDENSI